MSQETLDALVQAAKAFRNDVSKLPELRVALATHDAAEASEPTPEPEPAQTPEPEPAQTPEPEPEPTPEQTPTEPVQPTPEQTPEPVA